MFITEKNVNVAKDQKDPSLKNVKDLSSVAVTKMYSATLRKLSVSERRIVNFSSHENIALNKLPENYVFKWLKCIASCFQRYFYYFIKRT